MKNLKPAVWCSVTGAALATGLLGAPAASAAVDAWCAPAALLRPLSRPSLAGLDLGPGGANLAAPPAVPPPLRRESPATVTLNLETRELVMPLSDSGTYRFWTFGGSSPGPFLRVRERDTVILRLTNAPDSTVSHSIDLHAVTGSGGGASLTQTAPGQSSEFTFRALHSGLYVYHCATAPVPVHVANGMYGLILVEPPGGYPPVDREYCVIQSEFYTSPTPGDPELLAFDLRKASEGRSTHVVFNGGVGSLTGGQSLRANVGETVRLFVGNAGPNQLSSFHLIGEIFDRVYQEGGAEVTQRNIQTTLIPAGGAAIVELKVEVPGTFVFVDHSLFLGMSKGAAGQLVVEGPVLEPGTVFPVDLSAAGGRVAMRIGQRAELIEVRAELRAPDQSLTAVSLAWNQADQAWVGETSLPPNLGGSAQSYSVRWVAHDAFGQTSQTEPVRVTVHREDPMRCKIQSIQAGSGEVRMKWTSIPGHRYQVQSSPSLFAAHWESDGEPVSATAAETTQVVRLRSERFRFLRVLELE